MRKMKIIQNIWWLFSLISIVIPQDILPLTQRYFHSEDMGYDYSRGTYLIVLADPSLESILRDENTGDFKHFKQTQGYDVDVITFDIIGEKNANNLRDYLQYYIENTDSMLEYVLLIGDINGSYTIPSFTISSYNESDLDVTDYPYTFFNNKDILNPKFLIGRWSIRSQEDLKKIKMRSIQYIKMDNLSDHSFLNNALLVAGNYSDLGTWPVTPVWTSKWLRDELNHFGYNTIDTAFFHLDNQQVNNPMISSAWNSGVGIINYRGWGDANGWHKPFFHREDVDPDLQNGWYLPVVMSFVCNTGDFGNDFSGSGLDKCFGEVLTTGGSINNPKGAAAMIGPSDLDTDTRFNNVMCAVMWDELLEGRVPELGPALHAGKQALIKEFGDLEVNGTNIVEFYHHVYGVLGDPSLPVWLSEPKNMVTILNTSDLLTSSYISTIITDELSGEPIMDVVGALLYDGVLIAKGLSNEQGELVIDFEGVPDNSNLDLYFNKAQYYQKILTLDFQSDDGISVEVPDYQLPSSELQYNYTVTETDYNWKEINMKGNNLHLDDDSIIKTMNLNIDFKYYGSIFNTLTICSNGWVSFEPCLEYVGESSSCSVLPYFFNNSIPHPLGPYGMIAPFFDDLDDNNGSELFNVYFWTNSIDSVIVEWDNVANGQTDENCPNCDKETFQIILDNHNTSSSGNGNIIFQYKEIYDIDDHGSTVGIESPDKNSGIQYLFNFNYRENASGLQDNLAIKFFSCDGLIADECGVCGGGGFADGVCDCDGNVSDECGVCGGDGSSCAVYVEATITTTVNESALENLSVLEDNFESLIETQLGLQDGMVKVTNITESINGVEIVFEFTITLTEEELAETEFDSTDDISNSWNELKEVIADEGLVFINGCTDLNASNYNPDANIDDGSCTLDIDNGLIPQSFTLKSYPNPFNPVVRVSFAVPELGQAMVHVFDIKGRELATLTDQNYQPGYYSVNWNAFAYASGIYFITLTSPNARLTQKVLLLK